MPLRALSDAGEHVAPLLDDEQWGKLRLSSSLKTTCCGNRAICKTSSLGTRFFAHHRRGDCDVAPESREHLLAKALAVKGAFAAGWETSTEVPGMTSEGERFVADVLATKGNSKVAIEIQWSPQTMEKTIARQDRYRRAGIRGLWLFKRKQHIRSDQDCPCFSIAISGESVEVLEFSVRLETFIEKALSGGLGFEPTPGELVRIATELGRVACFGCRKEMVTYFRQSFVMNKSHDIEECEEFFIWPGMFTDEQLKASGLKLGRGWLARPKYYLRWGKEKGYGPRCRCGAVDDVEKRRQRSSEMGIERKPFFILFTRPRRLPEYYSPMGEWRLRAAERLTEGPCGDGEIPPLSRTESVV